MFKKESGREIKKWGVVLPILLVSVLTVLPSVSFASYNLTSHVFSESGGNPFSDNFKLTVHVLGEPVIDLYNNTSNYKLFAGYVYTLVFNAPPTAPTLALPENGSYMNDTTPTLTWNNATDPDGDTLTYRILVDNNSDFSSPEVNVSGIAEGTDTTSYTPSVALADGTYWWQVRANDGTVDGPWSATWSFILDTTPPQPAPVISSSTHPDENIWYSKNNPLFSWTTPQDVSGIAGYSYILDQIAETIPDTVIDTIGNSASYTDVLDGIWYFHVRAQDSAGNWGNPGHYQVRIDITPPPLPTLLSPADNSATKYPKPTFDWSDVTDDGSGLANYEIEVDNNSNYISPEYSATPTVSTAKPGTDLLDDTYYWHVRAKDNAGNYSAWTGSWRVRIDTVPPVLTSITLSDQDSGSTAYTNNQTIDVDLVASGNPTEMILSEDPNFIIGSWVPYEDPTTFSLSSGDGEKTVYCKIRDEALNESNVVNSSIILDTTPPAITPFSADPSPFNPSRGEKTLLPYELSEEVRVTIDILDKNNNLVRNIVTNESQGFGVNAREWNGKDDAGDPVAAGPYSFRIAATDLAENSSVKTGTMEVAPPATPTITNVSDSPDPFYPDGTNATRISYTLSVAGKPTGLSVTVKIFKATDKVNPVKTFNLTQNAGDRYVDWKGDDDVASPAPDGTYEYVITLTDNQGRSANPKKGTITLIRNNTGYYEEYGIRIWYAPPDLYMDIIQDPEVPTAASWTLKSVGIVNLYRVSSIYEITSNLPINPPALISFPYSTGLYGERLTLRRYNPDTEEWDVVETFFVDVANNRIVAEVNSFSFFAIFSCADTTPPVVTITSPEAKEYYHTTDGKPTIINITYTAQDPVVDGISSGVVKETVLLNGEEYGYETIDLSTLVGENTLTVRAKDGAGNIGQASVKFTVVLVAQVTIKPETLKVTPGVLTAYVKFPEGYNVAGIVDVTCDGALPESMMFSQMGEPSEEISEPVMIIKFRRDAIEEALSLLDPPQSIDTTFKVRGTVQDAYGTYIFEGTDAIMKVLEGSAPPEESKGKPR